MVLGLVHCHFRGQVFLPQDFLEKSCVGNGDVTTETFCLHGLSPLQHGHWRPSACQRRCLSLPAQPAEDTFKTPVMHQYWQFLTALRRTRFTCGKDSIFLFGLRTTAGGSHKLNRTLSNIFISPTASMKGTVAVGGKPRWPDLATDLQLLQHQKQPDWHIASSHMWHWKQDSSDRAES